MNLFKFPLKLLYNNTSLVFTMLDKVSVFQQSGLSGG